MSSIVVAAVAVVVFVVGNDVEEQALHALLKNYNIRWIC